MLTALAYCMLILLSYICSLFIFVRMYVFFFFFLMLALLGE